MCLESATSALSNLLCKHVKEVHFVKARPGPAENAGSRRASRVLCPLEAVTGHRTGPNGTGFWVELKMGVEGPEGVVYRGIKGHREIGRHSDFDLRLVGALPT